jgi:hypothetical protein
MKKGPSLLQFPAIAMLLLLAAPAARATVTPCEELPSLMDEMLENSQKRIVEWKAAASSYKYPDEKSRKAGQAFTEAVVMDFDSAVIGAIARLGEANAKDKSDEAVGMRWYQRVQQESNTFWGAQKAYGGTTHQKMLDGAGLKDDSRKKALAEGQIALWAARRTNLQETRKEVDKFCAAVAKREQASVLAEERKARVSRGKKKPELSAEARRILEDEGSFGGTAEGAEMRRKLGVGKAKD